MIKDKELFIRMYEIGLGKITIHKSRYFKAKFIKEEIFKEIKGKDIKIQEEETLKKQIQSRLIILLIVLKSLEYISKYSKRVWEKKKVFPIEDSNSKDKILYYCENHRSISRTNFVNRITKILVENKEANIN